MIVRSWRGATRSADLDAYLRYMEETGFTNLRGTQGNLGVRALSRVVGDRAEFIVQSLWESEEAIKSFAGDDIGRAVFYPEDDEYLVEKDEHVDHFEVVYQSGRDGR